MSPRLRQLALTGLAIVAIAGCTGSAGGPAQSAPPTTGAGPSVSPDGGGSEPGSGIGQPIAPPSSNDPGLPVPGRPTIVVPKPGRLDVHPVGVFEIVPRVDGRRVTVTLSWWSGVPPCSVLDSVREVRDGNRIALTVIEGADQRGVACIELAMLKATVVDLGELDPGTYTIAAYGDAAPIQIVLH